METAEASHKILDTMLGHLGIPATIDIETSSEGPCLQIQTAEEDAVIGRDGERLDDIQYLVNRILRRQFPNADRIKVDCGHFRTMREDKLIAEIRMLADRVKETGEPKQLRPLNAYYRRIVHNILINDPDVESHSPGGDERLKRITIRCKSSPAQAE
jgi:spoIIIJ-associated protein